MTSLSMDTLLHIVQAIAFFDGIGRVKSKPIIFYDHLQSTWGIVNRMLIYKIQGGMLSLSMFEDIVQGLFAHHDQIATKFKRGFECLECRVYIV